MKRLYPEAKLAIGPSIDTDFTMILTASLLPEEDLDAIEKEMKKIIKEGARLERFTLPRERKRSLYAGEG